MTVTDKEIIPASNNVEIGETIDYGSHYGRGSDTDSAEEGSPFLKIITSDSKDVPPEGDLGQIMNTRTHDVYDSIRFVPAFRERLFMVWVNGKRKAAYSNDHPDLIAARQQNPGFGKTLFDPDGDEIEETVCVYGVLVDDDGNPDGMACIAFKSTQLTKWKKGMKQRMDRVTEIIDGRKQKLPIYAFQFKLSVASEKNGQYEWFGWVPEFFVDDNPRASLLRPSDPLFQAAEKINTALCLERGISIPE